MSRVPSLSSGLSLGLRGPREGCGRCVCGRECVAAHAQAHRDVSPRVAAAGVSEDCCLAYHRLESLDFLKRALGYQRQEVSGSCNLPAVM